MGVTPDNTRKKNLLIRGEGALKGNLTALMQEKEWSIPV